MSRAAPFGPFWTRVREPQPIRKESLKHFYLRKNHLKNKKFKPVYIPKTTVPKPIPGMAPFAGKTLNHLFKWADTFVEALARQHGVDCLRKRLSKWDWEATSCFTGVGCAEIVSWQGVS